MKSISKISENEMIAEFLKGELNSERFGSKIRKALDKHNVSAHVIENPNLESDEENQLRRETLGEYRGYGRNKLIFENFPAHVSWEKVSLTPDELARVKYINYDYWNELSNKTRFPSEAAKNIKAGVQIFGVTNGGFLAMADALRVDKNLPPLILVAKDKHSDVVVLEGHARLTAYMLAPEMIPNEIEVIIGYSSDFDQWPCY